MSKNILPLKSNNIDAITEYEDKKPELLANSFHNLIMESRIDNLTINEFKKIISVIDEKKGNKYFYTI